MTATPTTRTKASNRLISALYDLLDEYIEEVEASNLSPSSKTDYAMFASQFVRWIDHDFVPGGQVR